MLCSTASLQTDANRASAAALPCSTIRGAELLLPDIVGGRLGRSLTTPCTHCSTTTPPHHRQG
eukprot:2100370-Alexandrium_andersonii.AAC.1